MNQDLEHLEEPRSSKHPAPPVPELRPRATAESPQVTAAKIMQQAAQDLENAANQLLAALVVQEAACSVDGSTTAAQDVKNA